SPPSQDTGEGLLHHQLKGVTSSTVVRYQLSQSNNGEGVSSLHEFSNAVGQQGNTFAASKDDNSKSEYHGNDIDGHHSIDPTSWAQRNASPPRSRWELVRSSPKVSGAIGGLPAGLGWLNHLKYLDS
ncbi:hypothetical protein BHM03_00062188, partial [Ensete ventricosum]